MPSYHLTDAETKLVKIGLAESKKALEKEASNLEKLGYYIEAAKLRNDATAITEDLLPKFDEQLPMQFGGTSESCNVPTG